ncbi:hypothetical protein BDM02DRAFT_886705 [Thelephora ganbajun]|uniref:Uncharacterized protein n=1 Tax=Thelephora ganbajun TaxID=370292 RepID=A0ACB6Z4H9_THEGA|nr:hypothetical protein BDM02DRAFT_886705 [Thelephora ganbajun]
MNSSESEHKLPLTSFRWTTGGRIRDDVHHGCTDGPQRHYSRRTPELTSAGSIGCPLNQEGNSHIVCGLWVASAHVSRSTGSSVTRPPAALSTEALEPGGGFYSHPDFKLVSEARFFPYVTTDKNAKDELHFSYGTAL